MCAEQLRFGGNQEVAVGDGAGIPLRALLIAANETDARVIADELRGAGYALIWERVETATAFTAALARQAWDVIIADYVLPEFSALAALALLRERGGEQPLIIVAGGVGEEIAPVAMRAGAHDFICKQNLARLPAAVERERRHAERRRIYEQTEAALRESEDRYRDLVENSQDLLCTHDLDGRILSVNGPPARALGYEQSEALGRKIQDILAPEARAQFADYLATLRRDGSATGLMTVQTRSGERRIWEYSNTLRLRPGSAPIVRGMAHDVTERRQANQELRANEERWQVSVRVADIAVFNQDRQLRYTWMYHPQLGYTVDQVLGKTDMELLPAADATRVVAIKRRVLETNLPAREEVQVTTPERVLVYDLALEPLHDAAGRVIGLTGASADITDRKRAQEELAMLYDIAMEVSRRLEFDDLLDSAQRRTAALLPCERVVTYYWDAARTAYRAVAWHGVPDDLIADTRASDFHRGETVVDRLLAGHTVVLNDAETQVVLPAALFAHFRLRALVLVPLAVRGHTLGALVAINGEGGQRFTAQQVRVLEGIAQQVGIAMESREGYRAQQEEAAVSRALVRVGQELISSVSSPVILDRLCQLTTEVLGCDYSHTWLWQPREQVFVAVACHGDSAEEWEAIRLVKLSRDALGAQLAQLERDGIINTRIAELAQSGAAAGARKYGATVGLMVPLRRGAEVVGLHTAGYRGRSERFDAPQERIARGIAHLASLALENARLVEELERANHLKSDFVATMSHELRTPLNIIVGYNDLLLHEVFGPLRPEQMDTLQRIDSSARTLSELITATLDVSRLESGMVPLYVTDIRLHEFMHEIAADLSGQRVKADVALLWDVATDLPPLRTDALKLKVIVKNLIENALKFTDAGRVTIGVQVRNAGVEIAVADTGRGMAPEVLPIIFEPFRQGDGVLTRAHGGVGLGLYIVRRLLDMLGGTISVASEVGCGSTFRVSFPQDAGAPRQP